MIDWNLLAVKPVMQNADVPIVLEVLVTKYAANKATTLLGDYTNVFVLLCYYRQSIV